MAGGEGSHSWHHADPACLVYKVKTPKERVYFAAKQLAPNPSLRQTHREWHIEEPAEAHELLVS